jgi:hypothetical protein
MVFSFVYSQIGIISIFLGLRSSQRYSSNITLMYDAAVSGSTGWGESLQTDTYSWKQWRAPIVGAVPVRE